MTVELDYRLLTFQDGSIKVILFQMGLSWNKVGEKETLLPAANTMNKYVYVICPDL
jgi:hypothetical protein